MKENINGFGGAGRPRISGGIILVAAGVLLLADRMGAPLPSWLFTWPVLVITIGLLMGINSGFKNAGSFIMIFIGGIFLVDEIMPKLNFHNYILPAVLIGIGLSHVLRPKNNLSCKRTRLNVNADANNASTLNYTLLTNSPGSSDSSEYVSINNAFGGIKRNIISKNFKGGALHNFMSGTELNLLQADIQQPIKLEVHNIFGGTKLIVPSNWDVINEMSVVFGGVEDKRNSSTGFTPDKTMVLKGSCIFGGVEVSNY